QLTLVDEQGNPIDNAFNSTVRLVNYDPEQQNSLAKIVRGELPLKQIGQIADPDYEPPIEPVAPVELEPVDITESELQLEEEPTTAEPEEAVQLEPEVDPAEENPAEIRSLEAELEDPADLSEPEDEPLDQLSDELEPLEVPAEEKPSQLPEDLSDFESAANESIEASEKLEEEIEKSLTNLEKPAADLTESAPTTPTDIPDTLISPSADDTSAIEAPVDSPDADLFDDASSADEGSEAVAP
ncbi:MAG: hypothetical protein ACR2FS_10480, partial [Phormidesmis sp.]